MIGNIVLALIIGVILQVGFLWFKIRCYNYRLIKCIDAIHELKSEIRTMLNVIKKLKETSK